MIDFPTDDEIISFTRGQAFGGADMVLRDLARIATILHLQDENFFDGDTVLAGGMALRCYGGRRFTVTDVDTSTNRKPLDVSLLDSRLNWELPDQLEVSTDGVGWYEKGIELEKAKPIRFEPYFSEIPLTVDQARFELTVNMRGLDMDPVEYGFRHHYPWTLGVEDRSLPLMDPREMIAEKIVGYAVNVLGKHYADVAFLAMRLKSLSLGSQEQLRGLVETKLERGRALAKGAKGKELYAAIPDYGALREPLESPDLHLNRREFGHEVRFVRTTITEGVMKLATARQIVNQHVVPWLFP